MFNLTLKLFDPQSGGIRSQTETAVTANTEMDAISLAQETVRAECRRGLFLFNACLADGAGAFWWASSLDDNLPALGFRSKVMQSREGIDMGLDLLHEEFVLQKNLCERIIPLSLRLPRCACGSEIFPSHCFCSRCGDLNKHFAEEALFKDSGLDLTAARAGCRQSHRVWREYVRQFAEHTHPVQYCIHCGEKLILPA